MNLLTEILNGRRAVTGDTVLHLGRFFGTAGEFWLNHRKLYELRRAEQTACGSWSERRHRESHRRALGQRLPALVPLALHLPGRSRFR